MRRVRRKSTGISPITTFVFLAFVIVAILCVTRLYDIKTRGARLREENRQLIEQKEALIAKNEDLKAQDMRGRDDAYIENIARTKLDMVYPGEIIFRSTNE